MYDTSIVLIGKSTSGLDAFLQPIETPTRTEVLAISVPVARSEFYAAGEKGIRPEFEFIINPVEYSGEEHVEFTDENGVKFQLSIYRIYERNADELEIYCQRAAGLSVPEETTNEQQ